MTLQAEGKLVTSDKVCRFLRQFCRDNLDKITIDHLLTHRSGLPREAHGRWQQLVSLATQQKLADSWDPSDSDKITLYFSPGETESYSNFAYQVLARIIEEASGSPYPEAMAKLVFEPAGIPSARAYAPEAAGCCDEVAQARYASMDGSGRITYEPLPKLFLGDRSYGADGVLASARDLLSWSQFLRSQQLIDEDLAATTASLARESYTHGWVISGSDAQRLLWHNGVRSGYASGMYRFLSSGYTVIYLMATDVHDTKIEEAVAEFEKLIVGEAYRAPKAVSTTQEDE